jgi:hypothetical protein
MAITQCEFFENEKKANADEKMLTQGKLVSSKFRCCCGTKDVWSDSKCLPLDIAGMVSEGTPIFGNEEAGIIIDGTDRVLDYGKKVRASGAVTNGNVPLEGGGEVPLRHVIVGVEEESLTSGKLETYVPAVEQTFPNKNMKCQKLGNKAVSHAPRWGVGHTTTGCCLETRQRTYIESYACGTVYNSACDCEMTKYCGRTHTWRECSTWEQIHHCRGIMAEQTGTLALRVDTSPGLCIGDRSTVESLEQQYGFGAIPNNVEKFALRYDAKKAKRGQCPLHWKPTRKYKHPANTANTMGPMPSFTFFCSCDYACQLSK